MMFWIILLFVAYILSIIYIVFARVDPRITSILDLLHLYASKYNERKNKHDPS